MTLSFDEIRFPVSISRGASGGPERNTEIVTLASSEERNSRWANSRRRYNAGFGLRSLDDIHAVIGFFDENEHWLAGVLTQGRTDKTLAYAEPPDEVARWILSTLEGALLVARPYGDLSRFNATAHQLLAGLAR